MDFLAGVVQLSCTSNEEKNVKTAISLIREAAACGAKLIVTPENTNYLGPHREKVSRAETLSGPLCARFGSLAKELQITLVMGSFNERANENKCANTQVVFTKRGEVAGVYRKIHLFDVDHSSEVRFLESDTVEPGTTAEVVDTEQGRLGLSICYDLRFPGLYQRLVELGAQIITVPSAFTLTTGKDHWEPLLRARAIETQSYVLAPGQVGQHDDGGLRESWGHSMIVDPWGQVVASVSSGEGFAVAPIELSRVAEIRRGMPVQTHRRM